MPLYEYRCEECGLVFEVLVRTEEPETDCPGCKSERLEKLVSGGSFILKGEGWFRDGYSKAKEGE